MHNKRVNVCGVNTYQLPVLSNVRMRELFRRTGAGDPEARQEIINGNLRLVLSVMQRFKNSSENPDDLFQVGCVGLLKAVDNFQLGHNVHFSTYAVPMIIGEIKRYLRDGNSMRVGRALKIRAHQAQRVREKLTGRLLREPTVGEIAAELGITPEEVVLACQASYEPLSLYEPLFNDTVDTVYVMDTISDARTSADLWLEDIALRQALDGLTERERHILQFRFFAGRTQAEIARELGLSQAQVSRIEKAALQQVRNLLSAGEGTKHAH